MDQWPAFSGTEVQGKYWPNPKNIALMMDKGRSQILSQRLRQARLFGNTIREADHWANMEAEGHRKIIVDRSGNTETWKAVTGWDGQFQGQR